MRRPRPRPIARCIGWQVLGGFSRSSQHLRRRCRDGTFSGMVAAGDGPALGVVAGSSSARRVCRLVETCQPTTRRENMSRTNAAPCPGSSSMSGARCGRTPSSPSVSAEPRCFTIRCRPRSHSGICTAVAPDAGQHPPDESHAATVEDPLSA